MFWNDTREQPVTVRRATEWITKLGSFIKKKMRKIKENKEEQKTIAQKGKRGSLSKQYQVFRYPCYCV